MAVCSLWERFVKVRFLPGRKVKSQVGTPPPGFGGETGAEKAENRGFCHSGAPMQHTGVDREVSTATENCRRAKIPVPDPW